ncbi:MAG: diguanylate cyclase [Lachnospiraceae bacterium]|nr:diguanylate cyclase [Lachnospiraceae bacterium]
MFTRKKKEKSIRARLLFMVLFPIMALGLMVVFVGMTLLYQFYSQGIRDELTSTTNIMLDCLDLTVRGDYSYESGMLLKGDMNITDSTMLYRVKEKTGIDTTIFWEDIRIMTTVENQYGVSAVGTNASPEVVESVFENGQDYYSNKLDITGTPYIGYYAPIKNDDNTVVGMIFAGKNRNLVYWQVVKILLWFLVFFCIACIIAVAVSSIYSKHMVSDIHVINGFLKTISEGDFTAVLDKRIAGRKDELGKIGTYASIMRSDLQHLIEMDPLTGLYNRRSCNNKLKLLDSGKSVYTIIMCDIDWFKKINDNYGHAAGDYVLVTVSELIRESINDYGFASRWGGEEFLLVYQSGYDAAIQYVRQIQQKVREYDYIYNGEKIKVTMTFGVENEDVLAPYEERIRSADGNMYIGKNNGRNRIVDGRENNKQI